LGVVDSRGGWGMGDGWVDDGDGFASVSASMGMEERRRNRFERGALCSCWLACCC
jgi:hypothetical protein